MKKRAIAAICCAITFATTPAVGQNAGNCTIRDQKGAVTFLLCPPGLDKAAWRQAGEAACRGRTTCSAWIWDDPNKAPKSAPQLASQIKQADLLSTVAIWDNDKKQMMMIRKVK
jgi:hypothetical protein